MPNKKVTKEYWNNPKEIEIPLAFGHISARVWGDESLEPVLALHGWQDNAGTFDKLIPLLNSRLCIVAIDALGHGMSSHKPPGTFYYVSEMVLNIQQVVSYLKWSQFSLLGHSMGGAISLLYSSIFPESVKNIILLDIVKPASCATKNVPEFFRKYIVELLKVEKKLLDSAPVYTIEEAKSRLISGLNGEVTEDSADILLKRGCRPSPCKQGVVFSRDIRVQVPDYFNKFSHSDLESLMRKIRCSMMIVAGKQSLVYRSNSKINDYFMNFYKENCRSFSLVEVDGNHYVHLNNPERVAPFIDNFFQQHYETVSKL